MSTNYIEKQINEAMGNERLNSVDKGSIFLDWVLSYVFDKSDTEIEENDLIDGILKCDGAYNCGIDASFIENDTISLIQTKYLNSNSVEAISGFLAQIQYIIVDGVDKDARNDLKDIYNHILQLDSIDIYYVTNDTISSNDWKVIDGNIQEVEKAIKASNPNKRVKIRILDINNIEDFIDESRSIVPKKFQGTKMKLILERYFENKVSHT